MIYLASPYSHPDPAVRQQRFEAVCAAAARMMARGQHVFSPIAHSHPIALAGGLPTGWEYWEVFDRVLIGACAEVRVLMLDGWNHSAGIREETRIALELGKPVLYADPNYV